MLRVLVETVTSHSRLEKNFKLVLFNKPLREYH
jgi:hypothetical protein